MKISIALCTYNGEKHLREQLDSFAVQTYPVNELVACDDGSTDKTVAILQDFAQAAPFPVRIFINKENLGFRANFEQALRLTTGDLIFFSDQDDIWPKEKVAEFVAFADVHSDRLGFFSNAWLLEEGRQEMPRELWKTIGFTPDVSDNLHYDDLCRFLLGHYNFVHGSMLAIRREALPVVLPFSTADTGPGHDQWIAFTLAAVNKLAFISKPLLYYRQHAGQEVGITRVEELLEYQATPTRLRQSGKPRDTSRLEMMTAWQAHIIARTYIDTIPAMRQKMEEFRQEALQAKAAYLKAESFPLKKLRLLKWFLKKEYNTSLQEVLFA